MAQLLEAYAIILFILTVLFVVGAYIYAIVSIMRDK